MKNIGLLIVFLVSLCSYSWADINYKDGGDNFDGIVDGFVTDIEKNRRGTIVSITFKVTGKGENSGKKLVITDGSIDDDAFKHGKRLEKAFDNGENLRISAKAGDLNTIKSLD